MKIIKNTLLSLILIGITTSAVVADTFWSEDQKELYPKQNYNYADEPALGTEGGQNTSSLVEGKYFRYVEEAFILRDEQEFERLYKLFRVSFPGSQRRPEIEEYRRKFFYNEKLKAYLLLGNSVKLKHVDAKTEKDLFEIFKKLKQIAIGSVEMEVVQAGGKKVYLFTRGTKKEGFFFETNRGPVVENLINVISRAAKKNNLKLYVSMPVRSFPELSSQKNYMLDESWNFLTNDIEMGKKLDLFNPAGKNYLHNLVKDLVKNKIDGIIFKADFAYSKNEGFSKYNRDMFSEDTGIAIHFDEIFAAYRPKNREFGILTREEYWDIAQWKAKELQQALWDLIVFTKKQNKEIEVGLEVYPEMLLDEKVSIKHYSTSLKNLKNLEVDFFKLSWRSPKARSKQDIQDYQDALIALREATPVTRDIMLDVPLNFRNQNIISLNEEIENQKALTRDFQGLRFAIGTLDRYEQTNFLQYPMQEVKITDVEEDIVPSGAATPSGS
ncbi:MAG: hypothetical protein QNL04_12595, partial [SAR324 cluster bacterium]|nr:hypothetical protein [SAR324 cluster bacterium]